MQRRKSDVPGPGDAGRRRRAERLRRARHILLIEHSRVDRLVVGAVLVLKGPVEAKLTEVADLDLAVSLLLQRQYDLILLDDTLPGHTPWETVQAVRAAAPVTPILCHRQYLDGMPDNGNGLDAMVEAVDAALAGIAVVGVDVVRPFSASGPWNAASAAS